jgi:hypothetical protein
VNRRHFLGQIAFGSAVVAAHARTPVHAASPPADLTVRFIGMMGFIERSDRSILTALPGHTRLGHYSHAPFLMARKGSAIASALELKPMPGVVAGAFDIELADERPEDFVYRCLNSTDLDVSAASRSSVAVDNRADQMAQMNRIAPGKRLRGNLRQWAEATVSLHGGQLVNAAAHPDAGKVWTFGDHSQRLTDAVNYVCPSGHIRLSEGAEVRTFEASGNEPSKLWVISAAAPRTEVSDPRRLEHGAVAFEYLADATPVIAYCPEAEGRVVTTSLPCGGPSVASLSGGVAREMPPFSELCYVTLFLLGR